MKKLEKDQLPKAIAVGLLATGLLGFAGYTWLGGGGEATPAVVSPPTPAQPLPGAQTEPVATNPVLQLAAIHHEDPFRPIFAEALPAKPAAPAPPPPKPVALPPAPKPAAKPAPTMVDIFEGPAMEALPGVRAVSRVEQAAAGRQAPSVLEGTAPKPAAQPAKPVAEPPPPPPAVAVTGILEGDENVAILKWNDAHRQVVRVGDRLDGGYVIKAIRTDAVVVTRGPHQWVVRLGSDRPAGN
jgi:hypothetical protein